MPSYLFYKEFLTSFFILSLSLTSVGQASIQEVEAYKMKMEGIMDVEGHDSIKLKMLLENINFIDPVFSRLPFTYIQKGIKIAKQQNLSDYEGALYNKLAFLYRDLSSKDSSEMAHEEALRSYKEAKNKMKVFQMHLELTNSYAYNDQADKSLEHGYKALELSEEMDYEEGTGMAYSYIAGTMHNFDESVKAEEFLYKALEIFQKVDNPAMVAHTYSCIADFRPEPDETSLDYINKAIDVINAHPEIYDSEMPRALFNKLSIYKKLENYSEIDKTLTLIDSLLSGKMSHTDQHLCDFVKAKNTVDQKKFTEGKKLLLDNISHPLVDVNPYLYYNYENLVIAYKALNQWDSAYYYQMVVQDMDTKQRLHESKMNMLEIERKYETEKKESTITAQKDLINKQKTIQWIGFGATLLLVMLLLQIYRSGIAKKEANKKLIELDALKTRLYTNITHEFRTPLTVILGMASQIEESPAEFTKKGTAMIQRNGRRLLELINQMLDLSKLENGSMDLNNQQGNIIGYFKYLSESVHSFALSKKIAIHFYPEEDNILMDFDEEKIKIIFSNLFSNAIKFTPEGGNIYIIIRKSTWEGKPALMMKFKDTGSGIPADQLTNIFDRFYQVDGSVTRKGEGTGIGLSLVREYILLMGGEISVKSKVGVETEFTILLPITNEAPLEKKNTISSSKPIIQENEVVVSAPAITQNAIIQDNGKSTLLLIEDNPDVVTYVESCLQSTYNILVGNNGQEGIEIALEYIPDIIVSDVMMPIKDGFEVSQTLKSHQLTSHIPIILLTAKADMDSRLTGIDRGAEAYLTKPFSKEELLLRLKKLIESRKVLQAYYLSLSGQASVEPKPEEGSPAENEFVLKLNEVVNAQLSNTDFSVEQFAKEIGMSSSQFHRKVSAVTSLSPNKYIRHIRLSKAQSLLRSSDIPINSIAYDTGFNDPGYFSRVFKKKYGVTPVEYRSGVKV